MAQALYFLPSWQKLQQDIATAAPDLDCIVFDENGQFFRDSHQLQPDDINPEYFWIHGDLFKSPMLKEYFGWMQHYAGAQWLHTINTGLDGLPYLDLLKKGMRISNNHSQAVSIAEYVLAHVLALYQNIPGLKSRQGEKLWKYSPFREVSGEKWLIIGFGHIGKAIAKRAKAFDVSVTAVRRSQKAEGLADKVIALDDLPAALPEMDVVVLACNSNDQTRGLMNKTHLACMKQGSVLINIARGDLLDETALLDALSNNKPAHAILDVFNEEPLPADSPLWSHDGVTISSHSSNAGSGMRKRSDQLFIENLRRMTAGEPLLNEVSERDIL